MILHLPSPHRVSQVRGICLLLRSNLKFISFFESVRWLTHYGKLRQPIIQNIICSSIVIVVVIMEHHFEPLFASIRPLEAELSPWCREERGELLFGVRRSERERLDEIASEWRVYESACPHIHTTHEWVRFSP